MRHEVPSVHGVPAERISEAIAKAEDAFWASLVESFPEVQSGDFGPEETVLWENVMCASVLIWLHWNLPHDPEGED